MAAGAVQTLQVSATEIADVKLLALRIHRDHRGFFSETYNKGELAKVGVNLEFVQDNHSLSVERGVVRGLHFQIPPFAQDKLVRVVRGAIFDVAVIFEGVRRRMGTMWRGSSARRNGTSFWCLSDSRTASARWRRIRKSFTR
jgi:dTDP-4-dehydrorhamnose 3,5-epimerase